MSKNFTLKTEDNHPIRITTFGNDNINTANCLIFVHGFKGFKDWGFNPFLAKHFAEKGFFVIIFNFSHNGVGENLMDFTELEKFADNTYSREVKELNQIIEAYTSGFFGNTSVNKIGIIGHSRGGGVAVLSAFKNENVSALATWASIAKLDRYTNRQKKEWKEKGFLEMMNTRTKQMMRLNYSLLNDILINKNDFLSISKSFTFQKIPYLIAHGKEDLAVPVDEANLLYEYSNKELTEFFMIGNTGHTFDIVHPFEGSSEKFDKLLDKTFLFFHNNLNKK